MTEASVARDYDRWLRRRSLSGRGYTFLAGVPGMILINTPVYRLDKTLALKPEHRLLDIGCGRGSLLQVLASRVHFHEAPVGIDLSTRMLGLAQRDSADTAAIDFVQGSALKLPLAPDAFDIVTCSYVIKHLDAVDLAPFLAEVLRVIKPGGFAVVWDFASTRSQRLDAWHRWLLTRGVGVCNFKSYAALAAAAAAAGFDWVDQARLRPFLFPPIPRVSVVLGKAPESWRERTGPGRVRRTVIKQTAVAKTA